MDELNFAERQLGDESHFIARFLTALNNSAPLGYCLLGGLAVGAYAAPLFGRRIRFGVLPEVRADLQARLRETFILAKDGASTNVTDAGSAVVAVLEPSDAPRTADAGNVFGIDVRVAEPHALLADLLNEREAARGSRRLAAAANIVRLVEALPELLPLAPPNLVAELTS